MYKEPEQGLEPITQSRQGSYYNIMERAWALAQINLGSNLVSLHTGIVTLGKFLNSSISLPVKIVLTCDRGS